MKLILLAVCGLALHAQTLTITLTETNGTVTSTTITGTPVTVGIEVFEKFRLDQCEERDAQGVCTRFKHASALDVVKALIIDNTVALSDRYPSSATAALRAAKEAADKALEDAKKALEAAAKGQ